MTQRTNKPDALIRRYLGRRSIREVARAAEIDHAMISRWARGLTRPDICSAGYLAFCDALAMTREQRCALALSLGADPMIVGRGEE